MDSSVAGKAEEMTPIVHEFMHIGTGNEGGRAFLRADEIDGEQKEKASEDDPRQGLPNRNRGRMSGGPQGKIGHGALPGFRVPMGEYGRWGLGLTPSSGIPVRTDDVRHLGKREPVTVARPRRNFTGFQSTNGKVMLGAEAKPCQSRAPTFPTRPATGRPRLAFRSRIANRFLVLRLTLLCHGPTADTRRGAFPAADAPLTDEALLEAARLNPDLRHVTAARCSPLRRARQTAQALDLTPADDAALRDLDAGEWAGQSLIALHQAQPEALGRWLGDPTSAPPGGETRAALRRRMTSWLNARRKEKGHIVAITHEAVIRSAALVVLAAPDDAFWRLDVTPFSLTDLRFDGQRWALRAFGHPIPKRDATDIG